MYWDNFRLWGDGLTVFGLSSAYESGTKQPLREIETGECFGERLLPAPNRDREATMTRQKGSRPKPCSLFEDYEKNLSVFGKEFTAL